ncbi:MAG: dUTP diphosphatase [Bacteroidales bacterium]|nr:dUTP diphosphatase [Bacteroidales bacterium]
MKVRIVSKSKHQLPSYSTVLSAGMDIRANIEKVITLKPLERQLIPTGLYIELPAGYEAQIRPRSGLAIKKGLTVLNTPGTIDADYRGEIGIIMINLSNEQVVIEDGDRICQMIISKHESIEWSEVVSLTATKRGSGGFGHTGNE